MDHNDFPNNVEIEKQVLGAMLIRDGEIIPKLLTIIIAEGKGVTFTNKDDMNAWLNSL